MPERRQGENRELLARARADALVFLFRAFTIEREE